MRKKEWGLALGVLFIVLFPLGRSWAQNPPTMLVVVRAADDSLWKMTCDEAACTSFTSFPGMFRYQPSVTWDEKGQEWVMIGTAADNSIWMATFDRNGVFNNDWQTLPGLTPSPAGTSGSFYTLGSLSCTSGQIPKWNGSAWACAEDEGVGGLTPSSTVADLDGSSSAGSSPNYSRGDHKHGVASGSITSTHIQDGTITNTDISAVAAIDITKLSGVASSAHHHDATYVNENQANSITGAMIINGEITDADISSTASISGTKLASDGSVVKSLTAGTNISVANNNNSSWTVNALGALPIGTVIDWWRPNASWPVPVGFAICDGSTVNDAGSPLNGVVLPNLLNRFIMGVTNANNIGTAGGSDVHAHNVDINHDHSSVNSSSAGGVTGNTEFSLSHNHRWAWGYNGDWQSWRSNGAGELMVLWGDGIGNEGEGYYPVASPSGSSGEWYTEGGGSHQHQFSFGSHLHSVDVAALGTSNRTSTTVSNVPPYYGLLKLMRIR